MFLPFIFEWDMPSWLWPQIRHHFLWDDTEDGTESEFLLEDAMGIEEQVVHAFMRAL